MLKKTITTSVSILSFMLLTACANTPATQEAAPPVAAASDAGAQKAAPAPAAKNDKEVPVNRGPIANPLVLELGANDVDLKDEARASIGQLVESKPSAHYVVTGFCDRKKISNAKEIALARATAVKEELVKKGVAPANIRVKFITTQSRHAVTLSASEK